MPDKLSNNCYISDPFWMERERIHALLETLSIAPLSPSAFKAAHDVAVAKLCTIVSHMERRDQSTSREFVRIGRQFSKVYSVSGSTVDSARQAMVHSLLGMMTGTEPFNREKAQEVSRQFLRSTSLSHPVLENVPA